MCFRPSFLTALISLAYLLVIIDVAGQGGNARTVVVVASRAGLSPSLSPTDRGPRSFTLSALWLMILSDLPQISAVQHMGYLILTWLKLMLVHFFIQEFSKHIKVMFLNAQSVRNKALGICDYIMQANVDLVFLCETWLRPVGDEADCAALTPPGFFFKSLPWQSGTCGGLAVLHRTSLTRNIAVSTRDLVFTAFEICEVRLSYDGHTVVFLSVYRPPT